MVDPVRFPIQLAIAVLKHHARKALGEETVGILAGELLNAGEDSLLAKVDAWLDEPASRKRLEGAIRQAGECFARSNVSPTLRQAISQLEVGGDLFLQEAIAGLPQATDETRLRAAVRGALSRLGSGALPATVIDSATDQYLGCLRQSLLVLKDSAPAVVNLAVLRIEAGLLSIRSAVEENRHISERTEEKLDGLIDLMRQSLSLSLQRGLIDYRDYLRDKTAGFVGREFVFEAIDGFLRDAPSGYFVLRGDPGIGKSAILARLVMLRHYPHHFNIAVEGLSSLRQFLLNAAAQIIGRYNLNYATIPEEAEKDSNFLKQVLGEAALRATGGKVILVVDALDEAAPPADRRANPLHLPFSLPANTYIITSTRRIEKEIELSVERYLPLDLAADSEGNLQDIQEYIRAFIGRPAMQARLRIWGINPEQPEQFLKALETKSEGNFMYLRHVLPAIEEGKFNQGGINELPPGLRGYYRQHWEKMRGEDLETFVRVYQKVIAVLATARQPVQAGFIARVTRLDPAEVGWALEKWHEFLHTIPSSGEGEPRYRLYHASYRDFLAEQVVSQ